MHFSIKRHQSTSFYQTAMYLPRRHSRRLLLPPGWVALGFLLLLGCQALLTHWRQMRLPNMIRLEMPMLKLDTTGLADCRRNKIPFPDFSYSAQRKYVAADTTRRWFDFNLTGSKSTDSTTFKKVLVAIKKIQADTSHANGARIYFQQHATYSNMVRVLDMMESTNQKIYWFDIYRKPATFYALTNKPLREPVFVCGTPNHIKSYTIPPVEPTFWRSLTDLWQKDWRPLALLFAVIVGLSCYQVARPRPRLR